MSAINNKIDFAVIISVKNANPNGDPLNGNRPRINYDGYGEISDVCLKRKLRNRLQDMGADIFVQSDDNKVDEYKSLKARADGELKQAMKDPKMLYDSACEKWIDVRSFGQVFAFKGDESKGVSVGVRGPVSIHPAFSVSPVNVSSIQITKSVNSEGDGKGKSSDTMGMKHRIDSGVYVAYGSINTQLASKTGFSDDDAQLIKKALISLFENDASSARPEGSMEVYRLYWWEHDNKNGQYSSAKVHRSLMIKEKPEVSGAKEINDYDFIIEDLDGLKPQIIEEN